MAQGWRTNLIHLFICLIICGGFYIIIIVLFLWVTRDPLCSHLNDWIKSEQNRTDLARWAHAQVGEHAAELAAENERLLIDVPSWLGGRLNLNLKAFNSSINLFATDSEQHPAAAVIAIGIGRDGFLIDLGAGAAKNSPTLANFTAAITGKRGEVAVFCTGENGVPQTWW